MKTFALTLSFAIGLFLISGISFAQEKQNKEQARVATHEKSGNNAETVAENQEKAMIQNLVNQENREKFKGSLTPEQVNILGNQTMTREEKRQAFTQSLSEEQKLMLKEQIREQAHKGDATRDESGNREQLKEQNRDQVREQAHETTGKQAQEGQMQQVRENYQGGKYGNNTESGSGTGTEAGTRGGNGPGSGNGAGN